MRKLPADLVDQLRNVRRLEQLADGLHRQDAAVSATAALMLAAVRAGWTGAEIAVVLGMSQQSVAKRVADAHRRFGDVTASRRFSRND